MANPSAIFRLLWGASLLLGGCMGSGAKTASPAANIEDLQRGLPTLAALPAQAIKHSSALDYDLLASAPVLSSAAGVDYAPGQLTLTPPEAQTMAYAVFALGGLPADGSVYPIRLALAADAQYWVAVSDYTQQHWRFLPYEMDGVYDIADGAGLVKLPVGTTYVALIAWETPASFTGAVLTTNGMPGRTHELWYYLQTNLQVQGNLDAAIAQLPVAAAAGYTKVLYADTKLEYIDQASDTYLGNLAAFDTAAKANGIEIVPSLLAVGYADGLLIHDPNLIEGQPVRDCTFAVSGGQARVVQDPATVVLNGDFEAHAGNTFTNWNQMDGAGVSTFADAGRTGGTSIRFSNYSGNDRIRQQLAVKPWQCYAIHFWLKTQNVSPVGQVWFRVFNEDVTQFLTYNTFPISQTQDWTQYHLIFNSQDKTTVQLYMGIWGGSSGQFWLDDVVIENAGLVNLVRRDSAPFSITSMDGVTVFTEGADYTGGDGGAVVDPLMGHAGSWPGTYDLWHAQPALVIPAGSRITEGQQLKVNFSHATFTDDLKAAVALQEPGVYTVAENLLRTIHEVLDPRMVFIAVDEHRVAGWCEPGFSAGTTAGAMLADFTAQIDQLAHRIDPTWRLVTWSDMYDKYHNMVADYYLCRGGMAGAIDGLPAAWDIANWNSFNEVPACLMEFSNHGNRQLLAGYYDQGAGFDIDTWLNAADGVPGVYAVMYTTWYGDYSQLANFAQAVRDWEAAHP